MRFRLQKIRIIAIPSVVMTSHTKHDAIKRLLAAKNWTQKEAAKECGVSTEHLNRVLNGHRESSRLMAQIEALPSQEVAP